MNLLKLPLIPFQKLWELFDGKKTKIGGLTLLIWAVIYGTPVLWPHAVWVQQLAQLLSTLPISQDEILVSGGGLTVVGLLHKLYKLIHGEEDDRGDSGNGNQ